MKNLVQQIEELSTRRCWEVYESGEFRTIVYIPLGYDKESAYRYLVDEWGYSEGIQLKLVDKETYESPSRL
jgi:hypothetical protein